MDLALTHSVRALCRRLLHTAMILSMILPGLAPVSITRADALYQDDASTPTPTITPTLTGTPADTPAGTPTGTPDPGDDLAPTPVISATATLTATLTPTPTATLTATVPIPTPTLTATLPSATPTPSPTPTLTPTVEPSATLTATLPSPSPSPTPTEIPSTLGLSLSADASSATPGGLLGLHWQVDNWQVWIIGDGERQAAPVLSFAAPPGLTTADGLLDPLSGQTRLEVAAETGWLAWQIPEDQAGPYIFTATLTLADQALITRTLTVSETGLTRLDVSGGIASGLYGRVSVIFPENAATEALDVRIRAVLPQRRPERTRSGHPFEILAHGAESQQDIQQFASRLTIEVAYSGKNDARLVYYNEVIGAWEAVESEYDRAEGVVRGWVDHLSVFDIDVDNYTSARMPSVDSFQVSQFTGSATYSFPIWTPPGPGGLQPSVALSYSSQVVESAFAPKTQGSWVGMGWSLDMGYFERNFHGTFTDGADDTFSVLAGGVSSQVLKDTAGVYHLSDENFWKVEYDAANDVWRLWDKQGARYTFGVPLSGQATHSARARYPTLTNPANGCVVTDHTWKWMLTETFDKSGNKLEYYYHDKESGDAIFLGGCPQADYDRAIYLKEIRYTSTGGRYRIFFDIVQDRTDWDYDFIGEHIPVFFQRSRLSAIRVVQDTNGSGTAGGETNVRTYTLTYGDYVFPGWVWEQGGHDFELTAIQESGLSGGTLPATTFEYDDLHLVRANNGYGGRVDYAYETTPWSETTSAGDNTDSFGEASDEPDWDGAAYLDSNQKIRINGTAEYQFAVGVVRPGGVYGLALDLKNMSAEQRSLVVEVQYGPLIGDKTVLESRTMAAYESYFPNYAYLVPTTISRDYLILRIIHTNLRINSATRQLRISAYRVLSKTLFDDVTDQSSTFTYQYDEPATNDPEHSAASAGSGELYGGEYSEHRGNAMSREIGPVGTDGQQRVITTWYAQDDQQKGQVTASMVSTRNFWQQFNSTNWNDYSSTWAYTGAQPVLERRSGDVAAKTSDLDGGWNTTFKRGTASLTNGEAALVQFRLSATGGSRQGVLALEYGSWNVDFLRWGIHAHTDGSLRATYCTTAGSVTTCSDSTVLLNSTDFKLDTWYVLLLAVDDDQDFLVKVWQRDRAGITGQYTYNMPGGITWKFVASLNLGTLYLDEYSEGNLYSLSFSDYVSSASATVHGDFDQYADLAITWTRPIAQTSMNFGGDGAWIGTRTTRLYETDYQGGTQYGNQTRQVEAEWNGSSWTDYRSARTWYYPYIQNGKYLVGLPAATNRFECDVTPCDDNPLNDQDNLLSSQWNLYDGSAVYWSGLTSGKLTGQRAFVCFANDSNACYTGYDPVYTRLVFADTQYEYDTWGNQTKAKAYSSYGYFVVATSQSVLASSGLSETTSCYGNGTAPTCNDDGYHTYKTWERNSLGHTTYWSYSGVIWPGSAYTGYTIGAPVSETGPNGASTIVTAEYDQFGRMTKVIRPGHGDNSASPTVSIAYHDSPVPFYTTATQKIDASTSLVVRKFYDGLGRLIQTQTGGAVLYDNACSSDGDTTPDTCDVIADREYDGYGNPTSQSVPYAVSTGTGYRDPLSQPQTTTTYDILGRVRVVTAPDGNSTETSYPATPNGYSSYSEVRVENARGNVTRTISDAWGRAKIVIPLNGINDGSPIDPTVSYSYNALDQLESATRGGAMVDPSYDYAGRKVKQIDPDLGTWYYSYDALGQMVGQVDARKQLLTLGYDTLGRATSKAAVDTVSSSFYDTFNTKDTSNWWWSSYQTVPYNDSGNNVVKSTGQENWNANFYRTSYSLASGEGVQLRFKVDATNTSAIFALEANDTTYRRFYANAYDGKLKAMYTLDGVNWIYLGDLIPVLELNTWYVLQFVVDDVGGFTVQAFKESDPAVRGFYRYNMPAGKSWRFHHWNYRNNAYIDEYREFKSVVYSYDAGTNGIGQRTAMSDLSGSTTWSYDVRGRVTQESKVISGSGTFVTQYTYNTADLPATMRYPADNAGGLGETVTFTYRPQGLINSVIGTNTTVKSTTYTAAGQVDVRELGDSGGSAVLKTDYDYFLWNTLNGQGRLKRILTQDLSPTVTTLQDLRYYSGTDTSKYDAVGNLLNIYDYVTGSPQTQTFSYDNLDRLHTAQAAGGTGGNGDYAAETYDYSTSSGNLSSKTGVGSYSYTAQSSGCSEGALPARPHAVTTAGTTTYCYDQDGNMTRRDPSGGAVYNFQYDAENRLVSASGSATASFVYDGDGVRVKGTVGGVTAAYVGSHFEWTGSTSTMMKYYYAGGARIAMRQGSTLYFLLSDHLGSTQRMTNADGSNYTTHLYKAWGEKRYPSGASGLLTTFRFTGQREQVEIGLHFYGARWWDSSLIRFAQADTIIPLASQGVQAWDRYAGMNNNPVRFNDPSGHAADAGGVGGGLYKRLKEVFIGGFRAGPANQAKADLPDIHPRPITKFLEWIPEAADVFNDLAGAAPQPPDPMNVTVNLSYFEYPDGAIDQFSLTVNNASEVPVYLRRVGFDAEWWDNASPYTGAACCALCGEYIVRPTANDWLSTIPAGTSTNVPIYPQTFDMNISPHQGMPPFSGRYNVEVSAQFYASTAISPITPLLLETLIGAPRGGWLWR